MRNKFLLILCLLLPLAHAQQVNSDYVFSTQYDEARFHELTAQLRCLVCQNQTLLDSDATLAKNLRDKVYDLVTSGQTNDEIIFYLTARYGDFILYQPPVKPSTWILWFTPWALLLLGAMVFLVITHSARRRFKKGDV